MFPLIPFLTLTLISSDPLADIRTIFCVNAAYDARIDQAQDGVMLHGHGLPGEEIQRRIRTWIEKDYPVFRIFFADSDAGRIYTGGKWDGKEHLDEIETMADGRFIECEGVRPYMIPTEGWIEYLKSHVRIGIDAGAVGIMPEEPISHTLAGYSEAFKRAYAAKWGEPWQDPRVSPDVWFRHSWVLSDLYFRLVKEIADYAKAYGREQGREIAVILPNHSTLSNAAPGMVFPNAAAIREADLDAFIGQVWTGPVGWSMGVYQGVPENRDTGFFENAYLLYSSFGQFSRENDLRMYFLIDPVEDDPKYRWEEYHIWYEQCISACLMFPWVTRYQTMPWPERIFQPGHRTGGGTPGPAEYLSEIVTVNRVLQDMEDQTESRWIGGTQGIGVLVSDSMAWMRHGPVPGDGRGRPGNWQNFAGFSLPLIKAGIPVEVIPIERMDEPAFREEIKVLFLSYNLWKPISSEYHVHLADWVREGGVLVFVGVEDSYDEMEMWWRDMGFSSPQAHLFSLLEKPKGDHVWISVGKGHFIAKTDGFPAEFSDSLDGADAMRELAREACERAGIEYRESDYWEMKRGAYRTAYALRGAHVLTGPLIDVYDPEISFLREKILPERRPGLFYVPTEPEPGVPQVLFWGGTLRKESREGNTWAFSIAGPKGTNGVLRVWSGGNEPQTVTASGPEGEDLLQGWEWDKNRETFLIRFGYVPEEGTKIAVEWK